jgi:formylmethanofuran dehydrogenase subunit E
MTIVIRWLAAALTVVSVQSAAAQTAEEWIELGTRIHGGFGVLIPIGIRIGLDAQERLQAEPRGLSVLYHTGVKAPCPCIADGVMIATRASPGQGTLRIAAEQAAPGLYAMITVRNRKTGQGIRYTISDEWAARIIEWNRTLDPRGRYEAAVKAEGLFTVQPIP